MLRKLRAF